MRKSISILAIVAALFMVCSCQKESTTLLRATINQYNGNNGKAYLAADDYVNWHVGDELWVNGQPASVTGSVSPFTIDVTGLAEAPDYFYAVYPKSLSEMSSATTATVTIPAKQEYRVDGNGNQILDAPMAAKQQKAASGATTLMFYNLASLFEISLPDNVAGATIKSISVFNIANDYAGEAINGTADVTFGDNGISIGAVDGSRNTKLEVNAVHVAGRKYYVAVAPVENAQFQVTVNYETQTHNIPVFTAKQANANNVLPANRIAPIALTTSIDPNFGGYYVSPGNVQCYIGDNSEYHYRFAAHQWEYYGESNLNADGSLNFPIDLFPYGSTDDPTRRTPPTNATSEMQEFVGNSGSIPCDFEIGIPAEEWRIPHRDLVGAVFARGGGFYDANNRKIGFGTMEGFANITDEFGTHFGVVLLPDQFPTGIMSFVVNNDEDHHNIVEEIGLEKWALMESLGAIFIPMAGEISSHGGYSWSGNHSTGMGFYTMKDGVMNGNDAYLLLHHYHNSNNEAGDWAYMADRASGNIARAFRLVRPAYGFSPTSK